MCKAHANSNECKNVTVTGSPVHYKFDIICLEACFHYMCTALLVNIASDMQRSVGLGCAAWRRISLRGGAPSIIFLLFIFLSLLRYLFIIL